MKYKKRRSPALLCAGLIALLPVVALAVVTVPAGTPIAIRTINEIDSKKTAPGERFRASVADPVVVGGRTAIPRGAAATIELLRTSSGDYVIKLHDVTVRGKRYDVASSSAAVKPASRRGKAAKRGLGGAGVGTVVGAIAGGGTGAAVGAVTGGGVGVASAYVGGKKVKVQPETLLSFELRAPLAIR